MRKQKQFKKPGVRSQRLHAPGLIITYLRIYKQKVPKPFSLQVTEQSILTCMHRFGNHTKEFS